jgi:glycosyltransferase involved in cell wall biosynthesis
MRNNKELITVIVTTYNSEIRFLEECVSSIINQTYTNIEILIIDDSSKKNIYDYQKKHLKSKFNDSRIKFYRNNKNYGVSYSLNKGIKLSKGKYINWCSYDDLFHPNKLNLQYALIKKMSFQSRTIISCNTRVLYDDLNYSRIINYQNINSKDALLFRDKYSGGSFLIPKSIFYLVGFFNIKLRFTQDYDMWLRMYDYNIKYFNLNKNLFYSRVHLRQDSNAKKIYANNEKNKFYFNYINKNINYFFNFYSFVEILFMANYFKFRSYNKASNIFLTKIKSRSEINFKYYFLLWAIIFTYKVNEIFSVLVFVAKKIIISFIKINNIYKRTMTKTVSLTS